MKKNFPIKGVGYWFFIGFACFMLLMLLIGQTGSLVSYEFAVKIGLQEAASVIGQFGVAMNRGFAAADTIIYIPLVIFAIIGFSRKKRWGLICMAGVMGITAYWPIVCLLTLIWAKGTPDFSFQNYTSYGLLLGLITIVGIWGLIYLYRISRSEMNKCCKDSERPGDVLREWVSAFNQADAKRISEFYTEDATNHQVTQDPICGKNNIYEMFKKEFVAAEMHCVIENIFEAGEWAILEWKDPLGLRGCGFFHIIDGKIVFQRGYWDKLSFLKLHNLPIPNIEISKNE